MTGEQLATWRKNRNLTQEALANHLGWTHQRLRNVETERTTMQEDITAQLTALDALLGTKPAANVAPARGKYDYTANQCWDLFGTPIDMAYVQRQPRGYRFYRLDNSTNVDEAGHQLAGLYETTRKHPRGLHLHFQLIVPLWTVRAVGWLDDPKHRAALDAFNAAIEPKRSAPAAFGMFQEHA